MDKIDTGKLNAKFDLEENINSLLKELRSDEEVYDLIKEQHMTVGQVKANVGHLIDFKNDYCYCRSCPGLDKCNKEFPHFKTTIRYDKDINYLFINRVACDKYMNKIKIESMYLDFDAPDEWKGIRLADLDKSSVRNPAIKSFVVGLNSNNLGWMYLTGNHKCGKSIMLSAFATEFANKTNKQISFVNSANMIKELSSIIYKEPEAFANRMELLSSVPLLVIDGFGNEVISEFTRDNLMFPLLANRSSAGLPTFFASDLSLQEISALYSVGKTTGPIRAKQLVTLIKDNSSGIFDITGIAYK